MADRLPDPRPDDGGAPPARPYTDHAHLVNDAYQDATKLSARQALFRFRRPGPDFHDRLLDLLALSGVRSVVDVGCGNAVYLDRLLARLGPGTPVVGVDLSPGILRSASHPTGRVVGDAQVLPLASESVDLVLALHMLYHVPRPTRAVAELRRVTRAGGTVVVSTNGPGHCTLYEGFADGRAARGSGVLGLDDATELLASTFDDVERHDFPDDLVVTDPDVVAGFLRSTVSLGADPEALDAAEQRARTTISSEGSITVPVHPGVLICRG